MRLEKLLKIMVGQGASDLFLRAGALPHIRVNGRLQALDEPALTKDETKALAEALLADYHQKELFAKNLDIDFIYTHPEIGRFRINIFTQRGTSAIVARYVTSAVLTFEELNLPKEL